VNRIITVFVIVSTTILCPNARGQMPQPKDIDVVTGSCEPSSHIAEGPIGADLTKRQSKFFCNSAAIMFFPDYKGHVMIQFAQKEAHHRSILGFSGRLEPDGIMMQIEHVYLEQGKATTASDGACKFFFKDKHISSIFCGAKIDETGRRTSAIVVFDAVSGQ